MYILSYDLSGMILALLFAIIHRFLFDRKEAVNKMFQTFMLIAAFECGMNVFTAMIIDGRIIMSDFWSLFFNQIYLAGAMVTAYYGYIMVAAKLRYDGKAVTIMSKIMLAYGEIVLFSNFFTGILFTVESGQYIKTPFFNIIYVISLMFGALIGAVVFIRKKENSSDERMAPVLFSFVLIVTFVIQGTGLGMNIVANLVKEMGGSISVESELFVGTKFHVEIPILFYDSAIIYSSPRNEEVINRDRVDLSAIKILCVDDTEINRTVFKGLLYKTGAYKLGRI